MINQVKTKRFVLQRVQGYRWFVREGEDSAAALPGQIVRTEASGEEPPGGGGRAETKSRRQRPPPHPPQTSSTGNTAALVGSHAKLFVFMPKNLNLQTYRKNSDEYLQKISSKRNRGHTHPQRILIWSTQFRRTAFSFWLQELGSGTPHLQICTKVSSIIYTLHKLSIILILLLFWCTFMYCVVLYSVVAVFCPDIFYSKHLEFAFTASEIKESCSYLHSSSCQDIMNPDAASLVIHFDTQQIYDTKQSVRAPNPHFCSRRPSCDMSGCCRAVWSQNTTKHMKDLIWK